MSKKIVSDDEVLELFNGDFLRLGEIGESLYAEGCKPITTKMGRRKYTVRFVDKYTEYDRSEWCYNCVFSVDDNDGLWEIHQWRNSWNEDGWEGPTKVKRVEKTIIQYQEVKK